MSLRRSHPKTSSITMMQSASASLHQLLAFPREPRSFPQIQVSKFAQFGASVCLHATPYHKWVHQDRPGPPWVDLGCPGSTWADLCRPGPFRIDACRLGPTWVDLGFATRTLLGTTSGLSAPQHHGSQSILGCPESQGVLSVVYPVWLGESLAIEACLRALRACASVLSVLHA